MNQLDQLRVQVRGLVKRIDALEAAARPARPKRPTAPPPADAIIAARQTLWARLVLLHVQYGHGRLTKLKFSIKYHLGDPSDFCRFLSAACKRRIPEGSVPAVRCYQALKEATGELEARRDANRHHSPENIVRSQDSAARPQ